VSDRAVSTVVDVAVCLLLVGAAALTLTGAPIAEPDPATGRAEELASTLAGSTGTVVYADAGRERTARGTLAGLLAAAAVTNRTPATGDGFRQAVANATRPALGAREWRGQVTATWRPYEGADPGGTVVVGPTPPPGVDVHAATTGVPSGLDPRRRAILTEADRDGYTGVATLLADAVSKTGGGGRGEATTRRAIAADLDRRFDSPGAAARAVRVGRVSITVRTWSP